ncbi:MAG: DnaB-like helicase C-terminal domain-containing protein, partial [Abditibacteriota bacterium]|nr:DnaB-like helicase C-terminal domain-containing protein [Abditibacteriota bacterium]
MKDSNDSQVRPSASALSPSKSGDSLQSIRAATKEFCRRLKGSAGQKTVLTGFGELDAATCGLQPANLVIVAARPGMGKTAFALNIALHAALREEKTVAIFSLEMSEEELVQRLIASGAETDVKCLGAASLTETERARVNAFAEELCNTDNILIDDTAVQSVGSIQAQCRRAAARSQKPDLIVIDYLQLMQSENRRAENRNQEISEIVRGLKLLAKEMDCPVMALSQ